MGEIYKSVGCVIAWLGIEGGIVENLFDALSLHAGEVINQSDRGGYGSSESQADSSEEGFDWDEDAECIVMENHTKSARFKGWFKNAWSSLIVHFTPRRKKRQMSLLECSNRT